MPSKMRTTILISVITIMAFLFLNGCGKASSKYLNEIENHVQQPDTDVTSLPHYNFASFSGTIWKTKVKVALVDVERYNGEHAIDLLVPKHFDPTLPDYTPGNKMRIIAVLPEGTGLQIGRLMRDNGEWGGLRVTAILVNATNSQKTVYLDEELLALNPFLSPGSSSSTNWAVNPDMLETVTNAP